MDKGSATMTGCDVEASSAVQTTAAAPATTAAATAAATAGWMEKFSAKHQKPYWKNRVSGEVTWKNPLAGKGVVTAAAAPATRKKSTTTMTAKKKRKSQTDDHSSSSTYSLPAVPSRITGHQVDGWQTPMDTPDQFVTGIDTPTVVPATAAVAVGDEETPLSGSMTSSSSSSTPSHRASRLSILITGSAAAAAVGDEQWVEKYHLKTHRRYWKNTATGQVSLADPATSAPPSIPAITDETATPAAALSITNVVDHGSQDDMAQTNAASSIMTASSSVPVRADDDNSLSMMERVPSSSSLSSLSVVPVHVKRMMPPEEQSDPSSYSSSDRSPLPYEKIGGGGGGGGGWVERFHEKSQRTYWKNKVTGESKWNKPPTTAISTTYNDDSTRIVSSSSRASSSSSSSSSSHREDSPMAASDSQATAADGHLDSSHGVDWSTAIDGWIECYRYVTMKACCYALVFTWNQRIF